MPKEQRRKHGYTANTFALTPNTPGILISCNRSREPRCISEFRDLCSVLSEQDNNTNTSTENVDSTIEDALEREIKHLRRRKHTVEQVQLGDVKCLIFVKMSDPVHFIDKLFDTLPSLSFYPKYSRKSYHVYP